MKLQIKNLLWTFALNSIYMLLIYFLVLGVHTFAYMFDEDLAIPLEYSTHLKVYLIIFGAASAFVTSLLSTVLSIKTSEKEEL